MSVVKNYFTIKGPVDPKFFFNRKEKRKIKNAVKALGFNVLLWNESQLGRPSLKLLTNENVTMVIWHTGTYWNYAVDSVDADTLIEFVKLGGRLLLEGEDIGYNHGNDTFKGIIPLPRRAVRAEGGT